MNALPETMVVSQVADVFESLVDRQAELLECLRELRGARDLPDLGIDGSVPLVPVAVVAAPGPSTLEAPAPTSPPAPMPPLVQTPAPSWAHPKKRDYDYFSALERRIAGLTEEH